MFDLYLGIAKIAGLIFGILFCGLFLNFLLQWASAYIDDRKHESDDFITKHFILRFMGDLEASRFKGKDGEMLFITILFGIILVVIFSFLWPITIIYILSYVTLKSLRSVNRLKKKIGKVAKVAHKHLDEVNIEELKE